MNHHALVFSGYRRRFWQSVVWVGLSAGWVLQAAEPRDTTPTAAAPEKPERKDPIKIYIHTDLEGISGINSMDMIERTGQRYRQCCEHLMADLNVAIDGAFAGGATHVTVLDSHGGGNNFIVDLLDPRVKLDTRPNKKWRRVQKLIRAQTTPFQADGHLVFAMHRRGPSRALGSVVPGNRASWTLGLGGSDHSQDTCPNHSW